MKTKSIISTTLLAIALLSSAYAADIAWFVVNVDPSTVKVGEPANVTIKAIDENGDTVTDYDGEVTITVEDSDGNELDDGDYVVPNEGDYTFTEEDQWEKIFSKWLKINKAWDFKVVVEDFDTDQNGKWDVKVVEKDGGNEKWKVTIITPQNGETITSSSITISWNAPKYRNSKIKVYVDGSEKTDGQIDETGNFTVDLTDISNGTHTIKVEVLDIDDNVLATSDEVKVNATLNQDYLKSVEILPGEKVNQWTKVQVNVEVDPKVSSAVLKVANYGDYPMDRVSWNKFTAQFRANTPGAFDVSVDVKWDFGEKKYENVKKLTVVEEIAIKSVKFVRDNHAKTIALNWKFTWQVPAFKVLYGTWKQMWLEANVKENKYTIENIDEAQTYFIQIVPTDSNGNKIWTGSRQIVIEPNMKQAATCKIDNIKVQTAIEWDKHYLVWEKWEWVVKYLIYSGKTTGDMVEIASTTWTNYLVPFNKEAKKKQYAYFAVKAVCDDGDEKQIDKVKKVQVGPMDWAIYALIISMIIYGLKLTYSKQD